MGLKKSLSIGLKKSGFEKSLSLKKLSQKKSQSQKNGLKKGLGIGHEKFGLKKVSVSVSNEISGLVTQCPLCNLKIIVCVSIRSAIPPRLVLNPRGYNSSN